MKSFPPVIPDLPHILYGGDYNPEQWPEEVWLEDALLMEETGVNLVSVGIFSWALIELAEGQYDFAWLRRVLDILHQKGIGVCLATATASPPAWFTRKYPESRPVTAEGVRLDFGSRQHYCPNSPEYRTASDSLIQRMVRELGGHPAVKLWHLNNEIGCHIQECHCARCQTGFREWLKAKYVDLAGLNEAWGTAFWSQRYTEWNQIATPGKMPTLRNPGHHLDYKRFFSDSLGLIVRQELSVIRNEGNQLPCTTNGMGFHPPGDYFKWYEPLDVAAWDSYPDPSLGVEAAQAAAFGHDLNRSLKHGRPFLLMEQVTSQVNWRPVNMLKPPGMMRAHNYQAIARGADACMFFQWRASKAGSEKFHGAMISHYGTKGRVFGEVKVLGNELKKLDALVGTTCPAEILILASWENLWAVDLESKPAQFNYAELVQTLHGACWQSNLLTDIAPPSRPIPAGIKLVIAPLCYLLSASEAGQLRQFVAEGGTLLVTYFSGIADEREHIGLGGYPSMLTDLLGLVVEEWQPYPADKSNTVAWSDGRSSTITRFAEILHTTTATPLATYAGDFFAGSAAVTVNSYGKGKAYYSAAHLSNEDWQFLVSKIATEAGIVAPARTGMGVEVVRRGEFLVAINHNDTPSWVDLDLFAGAELLSNKTCTGRFEIEPFGVRVIAPVQLP